MCEFHKCLCPTPHLLINYEKNCFICRISNCDSFSCVYLQQIAGCRASSPYTLFPKLLTNYEDSRGFGSPISSSLDDTTGLREGQGDLSYGGLAPSLETSCLLSTLPPCFQRSSSTRASLLKQTQPCSSRLSLH